MQLSVLDGFWYFGLVAEKNGGQRLQPRHQIPQRRLIWSQLKDEFSKNCVQILFEFVHFLVFLNPVVLNQHESFKCTCVRSPSVTLAVSHRSKHPRRGSIFSPLTFMTLTSLAAPPGLRAPNAAHSDPLSPRWEQRADWLPSRHAANHAAVLLFRAEWEASPVGRRRISSLSVMSTLGPDCSLNGFSMIQTLLLNLALLAALNARLGRTVLLQKVTRCCTLSY